ncbi:phosphotransferase [bacterium]|nr:phosphotransferase [candidate division CSSED10-310 bacterium]
MHRCGLDSNRWDELDGFESFIFDCAVLGVPESDRDHRIILRVGHSGRRRVEMVRGEIDFIRYLSDRGISAARALPFATGNTIETFEDGQGEEFIAVAFRKIIGTPPATAGWTDARFEDYGQLVGRMHRLTKAYRVPDPAWKRPEWDDPVMHEVEESLDAGNRVAVERYRACCERAAALSRDIDAYGLVHFDVHGGNMLVDDAGELRVFDFDDAHYTWFANDIAVVLYYMLWGVADPPAFTDRFMTRFLTGYTRENRLDAAWLETIPLFMKMRQIDLYALLHRSSEGDQLDASDPGERWRLAFIARNRPRIENDVPVVDYDFRRLARWL